jgi:hypothetical protein
MTFTNFPDKQFFIIPTSNGSTKIATVTLAENLELAQARLHILKVGAHNADDRFTLELYSSNDVLLASSDSIDTVDFEDIASDGWYGYVTFEFNRFQAQKSKVYTVKLKLENTTYTSSRYYGVKTDWPYNFNNYESAEQRGASMIIAGYR